MLINVETPVLDHRNKPIIQDGTPVMVGDLICSYVLTSHEGKFEDNPSQKVMAFKLARRISTALDGDKKEIQISHDEISYIKEKANAFASNIAWGGLMQIIDPGLMGAEEPTPENGVVDQNA